MFRFFNKRFKDKQNFHWSKFEYFNQKWKKRIFEMSKFIEDNEKTILDLGCGRMWLKEYLRTDIKYYGCDYIERDEHTIICDFNKLEFPKIHIDLCFASGIVEYIHNFDWFIGEIAQISNCLIVSYCHTDFNPNLKSRIKQGWQNHFSEYEFIKKVELKGFHLQKKSTKIKGNGIYKFCK